MIYLKAPGFSNVDGLSWIHKFYLGISFKCLVLILSNSWCWSHAFSNHLPHA